MTSQISFDAFREQWLKPVYDGTPSPVDAERRFALKLFSQWRDIGHLADDVIYLDGVQDHNIDLIYIERGESDDEAIIGETWYIVQSILGATPIDLKGLTKAAQRAIDTLDNASALSATPSAPLAQRLAQFRQRAGSGADGDRVMLIIATELPLDEQAKQAIDDIRADGRERLGPIFDVEAVSIETIYLNTLSEIEAADEARIKVLLKATLAESGDNLLIGSVTLPALYDFLRTYRDQTEDLDQLYEKNVRRFLGGRRRVNRGMQKTLLEDPEQFGLYNNGITLVVKGFRSQGEDTYELMEPYVVNGCQTTRSIWEVFQQKLFPRGRNSEIDTEWQARANEGVVVTKIVRIGRDGDQLLQNITRYTNSQNAVSEKDFITLENDFRRWSRDMEDRFGIFLEIQRGGWDSRQALQQQNPTVGQFTEYANAFDLLKAYGAGWLREAGTAFGRNAAFVPGAPLYRRIVQSDDKQFDVEDLFAAYHLHCAADSSDFGRGSRKSSRRQTRFLFYMVLMDLLRDTMIRSNMATELKDLTHAMLKLFKPEHKEAAQGLVGAAVGVVDEYLTQGEDDSVFTEPAFKGRFNNDLNGYLKWDKLGQSEDSPSLHSLMAINKRTMGRGNPSPRDLVTTAIQ